jgi:ERCC4-related helicase
MVIQPKDHQLTGLAHVEQCVTSPFKGVMIGDPSGLGKTLVAAMAVVKALPKARRFSIVVVPTNLIVQWDDVLSRGFEDVSQSNITNFTNLLTGCVRDTSMFSS